MALSLMKSSSKTITMYFAGFVTGLFFRALLAGCFSLFTYLTLTAQIHFKESAKEAGIDFKKMEWTIGNGVSFYDFDGDGWDDITLATDEDRKISVYRNIEGFFEKIETVVDYEGEVKQILWVDFDNDGDNDLYLATMHDYNRLYENVGQGDILLVDITEKAGLPLEPDLTHGAIWGDVNRDGWLDLYFGARKIPFNTAKNINRLFISTGEGNKAFTEITNSSKAGDPGKIPFCSAFLDVNNDKWPDIYTANDKLTRNTLLLNDGEGSFQDISNVSNAGERMNAMCVAVGDYDNDGWQDIYVTNTPVGNALLHNMGAGMDDGTVTFENIAAASGAGFYGNGWASNFLDAENDGDLDLYVSGSMEGSDVISSLFYENNGDGSFMVPQAGLENDTTASFSNAIGDFNNDGLPDVLVQNNPPFDYHLWENQSNGGNWLKVELQGVKSNRDAIGSRIEIYINENFQMRYTHCGIGFLGQNTQYEIFGTGQSAMIDSLLVKWPTGHIDRLFDIDVNQRLSIIEGSTTGGEIFEELLAVDEDNKQGGEGGGEEDAKIVSTDNQIRFEQTRNYKLYPNPAKNILHIEIPEKETFNYQIVDVTGKQFQNGIIDDRNPNIVVDHLPAQLYYIFLTNDKHKPKILKWIKD